MSEYEIFDTSKETMAEAKKLFAKLPTCLEHLIIRDYDSFPGVWVFLVGMFAGGEPPPNSKTMKLVGPGFDISTYTSGYQDEVMKRGVRISQYSDEDWRADDWALSGT